MSLALNQQRPTVVVEFLQRFFCAWSVAYSTFDGDDQPLHRTVIATSRVTSNNQWNSKTITYVIGAHLFDLIGSHAVVKAVHDERPF